MIIAISNDMQFFARSSFVKVDAREETQTRMLLFVNYKSNIIGNNKIVIIIAYYYTLILSSN